MKSSVHESRQETTIKLYIMFETQLLEDTMKTQKFWVESQLTLTEILLV